MIAEIRLPLTDLQGRVLDHIYDYIQRRLYPPTVKEIQQFLSISNPGTVYKVLSALAKKGYIKKQKHVARGIRLTPLGEEVCSQNRQLQLELKESRTSINP